jgi:cellulose synthase/poly-beta-1,6-N-acetylglucosamine synthase-like glycosyltransferase
MAQGRGEMPPAEWVTNLKILPKVSVVIPTYNEAKYIEACIKAILAQDYPKEKLEIHVVDGDSKDGLLEIIQQGFVESGEPVLLHSNPQRKTPIGLNIGVTASTGDIVIILGAHTEMFPSFIQKNVENLRRPGVVCSGGTQMNSGRTAKQAAIGAAMSHRFGIATAPYRHQVHPGEVFTVVYGAYRSEIFELVGYFEEEGSISEDAEFNWRIIQAGYKVYFDPDIKTRYYPRATFAKFARQMHRYGILRAYMFRKHLEGLSILHFMPSTFCLLLVCLGVGSFFNTVSLIILISLVGTYSGLALISSLSTRGEQKKAQPLLVSLAFFTMHIAWGLGFISGLISRKIIFKQYIPQLPSKKDSE